MLNRQSISSDRRRLFWATQPAALGIDRDDCNNFCGKPGFELFKTPIFTEAPPIFGNEEGGEDGENEPVRTGDTATISTEEWVRGLIINMLMTDGRRPNTPCGYSPKGVGGHWSESFISGSSNSVGSLIRTVEPQGRTNQLTSMVAAQAQSTLQKLVERGVAVSVEVTVSYEGAGRFSLDVIVFGQTEELANVALSGTRIDNAWIWN